jgi:thymidylate synthase
MIRIQKNVADRLSVEIGHYLDFSNSLHIYGVNILEVKDMFTRMKNRGESLPQEVNELLENQENN